MKSTASASGAFYGPIITSLGTLAADRLRLRPGRPNHRERDNRLRLGHHRRVAGSHLHQRERGLPFDYAQVSRTVVYDPFYARY